MLAVGASLCSACKLTGWLAGCDFSVHLVMVRAGLCVLGEAACASVFVRVRIFVARIPLFPIFPQPGAGFTDAIPPDHDVFAFSHPPTDQTCRMLSVCLLHT